METFWFFTYRFNGLGVEMFEDIFCLAQTTALDDLVRIQSFAFLLYACVNINENELKYVALKSIAKKHKSRDYLWQKKKNALQ